MENKKKIDEQKNMNTTKQNKEITNKTIRVKKHIDEKQQPSKTAKKKTNTDEHIIQLKNTKIDEQKHASKKRISAHKHTIETKSIDEHNTYK